MGAYKIRADYKRKTDARRTACRAVPTVADKNGERLAVPLRKKERKKGGWINPTIENYSAKTQGKVIY